MKVNNDLQEMNSDYDFKTPVVHNSIKLPLYK